MRSALRPSLAVVLALTGLAPLTPRSVVSAQQPTEDWDRHDVRVPVRDGTRLYAVVVAPKVMARTLPVMLVRTPYGVEGNLRPGPIGTAFQELAKDGYIFVFQDARGTYKSEGKFVMNGALHDPRDPNGVDEATDTYDTVDWLLKNLPNNSGKVGVMGVSYPGWLAGMAGVNPHPAVKAISPQAPMTDTWMGDDFFHQGAFRQSFGVEYATEMEWPRDQPRPFRQTRRDLYDWYLQFPTLKELGEKNGISNLPSWTGFRTHPAWDGYWQAKAMQRVLTKPLMPVLNVGGFWDQEDVFGPQEAYRTLEKADTKNWNHIVLGPWFHGGWSGRETDNFGPMRFGSDPGLYYRSRIEAPWFAYHLHGKGDGSFAEAYMFESGSNTWRTFNAWPPREGRPAKLYLRENGKVSFDAPKAGGSESYVSDPKRPIPYLARPVDGTRWQQWLVEDQRFVQNRPDVLSWESDPLTEEVSIAGDVIAHLYASTTGTDADWVVKLIDVYPDSGLADPAAGGYQLMVAGDIMRGRYRKSWSKPEAIPANTVTPFTVDLHEQSYRFLRGHRIMVQVQSTWFPLYDRNPQTFVPNIFEARASDFRAQTHTVHHSPAAPSHIAVTLVDAAPAATAGDAGAPAGAAVMKKARAIHTRALTMDTHVDFNPGAMTARTPNYVTGTSSQVDLPKMERGGLDAVFFSIFVGQRPDFSDSAYRQAKAGAMEKFDAVHRLTEQLAPDRIQLALTAADVRRIHAAGKKVALMGVEGGYPLGEEVGNVKAFYDLGARYLSLAHNGHSQLSDSNTGEADGVWKWNGLSPIGRQVVAEANRLGIMMDVSHPSKASNLQMIALSRAPVIASHSAVRALCDHSRNLDDEQLLAIARGGGVVQVVAFSPYLKKAPPDSPERAAAIAALRTKYGFGGGRGGARADTAAFGAFQKEMAEVNVKFPGPPRATVRELVDHIDYAVKLIGIDHVGISSDFDGGGGIDGYNSAAEALNVTVELVRRGYTEEQIDKLWGGNLLRVMEAVEGVAARLKAAS